MAKTSIKKKSKKRAPTYEPKVKFDGTFQEIIDVSIRDAARKKYPKKK